MILSPLLHKCLKNDRKAQLKLYSKYCDAMFTVSLRYMNNEGDAEDVTQEAFIKAFKNLNQYKGEVTFGAWLKKIVINTCLDHLKKNTLTTTQLETENILDDNDELLFIDEISLEVVKSKMDLLPENQKVVTLMYLVEGYDHNEISEILNISVVNSRALLSRGKKQLKELLKTYYHG